jgi:Helicase associated domain
MDPNRRQRIEPLPGSSRNLLADQWDEGFSHLKQFSDREGHCRVSASQRSDDGYRLGLWVSVQRRNIDTMKPDRRQRLETLRGWSWDAIRDKWEEGFSHLKQFSERVGHCRVSQSYRTDDGYRLGQWVSVQRSVKRTMKSDRRQRLEALPRWSWNAFSDKWEEGFSHLKQFSERVGYCRVSQSYTTDDGYRLGQWVSVQRAKKETMEPDRRQRLEALLGWSWDPFFDQWEEGFSRLKDFSGRLGHCRVLYSYKCDDDYRLGQWVTAQRRKKDQLGSDRRQRLEALPGWLWRLKK